jgi:ABC-type transport system substrate-binding protein
VQGSYWSNVLERRLSRRRALAAAGAGLGGAAILSACGGGGEEGPKQPEDKSGLLFQISDETKNAKKGGKITFAHPLVLVTLDPMFPGGHIRVARRGYSQLFRIKDGVLQQSDGSVMGDFAESFELTPDKLTLTVKIDPGVGLPPVAPVNGRTMDADDVLFSWERLKAQGIGRAELAYDINKNAPIVSITKVDNTTLTLKLAEPNVTTMALLGSDVLGSLYIIPKEARDGKFDPVKAAWGSGPYYMTRNEAAGYAWKRNPNFKRASLKNGEPFVDEIDEPVLTDLAAQQAQFRAGTFLMMAGVLPPDIIQVKKDLPQLLMRATPPNTFNTRIFFGSNPDSPFKDERVRIAFMKCIDRDALLATNFNTDKFAQEGLPVDARWEGPTRSATYTGWWLDPKGKDFGPNAKNFVYSLEDAKALLKAATGQDTLAFDLTYAAAGPTSFPIFYYTAAETWMGMIESSGVFKQTRKTINYASEWTPQYRNSKGKFTGVTWGPDTAPAEAVAAAFYNYNSAGGAYYMGGDSTLDEMTVKARQEFDDKKRMALMYDFQRYEAGKFYNELYANAGSFQLAWPALRNILVYRGGTNWMDDALGNTGLKAWIDPEQPPLKKA